MAGMPAAAHPRRCAEAGIGCGVQPGIRWPASCGHPRCRERATYVPGPGRCERPGGRRCSNSEPGCAARSPGVRSSLADRIRGEGKISCCVTTRGRNFRVLNGLGRDFGSLPALLLGLGMLGCMRRAFDLLAEHKRLRLDLATIPPEDPATYEMIRHADTASRSGDLAKI